MRMKSILLSTIVALSISGMAFAAPPIGGGSIGGPGSGVAMPDTLTPPTPPAPTSPDPLLPLDRLLEMKELTPTSQNLDLTNQPLNLAGTQMTVAPLYGTQIVNNIDTNQFSQDSVGTIAINNSADHMIAVSEFTPIGAASQIGDNEDLTQYDFIIPAPILE